MAESRRPRGGDAELDSDEALFQRGAASLIGGLFVMLKVAMVHRMDNQAVVPVAQRFSSALAEFQSEVSPDAAVQFVGDAVYINRRLVHADLTTWEKAGFLATFFAKMNVAEISFHERVPELSIREFIQAVREVALDPSTAEAVHRRRFLGISFRDLEAHGVGRDEEALVLPDRFRVLRAYGVIVATLGALVERLQQGKSAPLVPVRRAVQEFVRLPDGTRPLQLGILSLEHYRDRLPGRLASLAIMVVCMGKRLGLGVADLRDAGVAAGLCGVGRAMSGELVFASPDTCAAWDAFAEGARWLVPYSGHGKAAALRIITAIDQGSAETRRRGHPLSRLIAVADRYDLATQRPPRGLGLTPDAALQELSNAPDLDRAAVRLLVTTLGLFPVGTTVRLSTGETAIVVDVSQDPRRLAEPRVMVVADAQGAAMERRSIDLAESGVSIEGTIDPAGIDLNVGHFLFA